MSGWNRVVRIERCSNWPSLGRAAVRRSTTDVRKESRPNGNSEGSRVVILSAMSVPTGVDAFVKPGGKDLLRVFGAAKFEEAL